MVIELKNDFLTVQFKEFGGALSSIKIKTASNICGKEIQSIGVHKHQYYFRFVGAYVMMKLFIVLVAVPILQV